MRSRHDDNQNFLRGFLVKCGWQVVYTTSQGGGFPDAVCYRDPVVVLVEFKIDSPNAPETQLLKDQMKFHEIWKGAPIYIVRNEIDCFDLYAKELDRLKHSLNLTRSE
jgi:Holliday junction resolvase